MKFKSKFNLIVDNEIYKAEVIGFKVADEFDRNSLHTEIQSIKLLDENDNVVTKQHNNYEELIDEVVAHVHNIKGKHYEEVFGF